MLSEAIVDVVPYLDVVFSGHLGRVKPIQIFVEGYACLDELHESDAVGVFPVSKQSSYVIICCGDACWIRIS